jgi:hypothetical protein
MQKGLHIIEGVNKKKKEFIDVAKGDNNGMMVDEDKIKKNIA